MKKYLYTFAICLFLVLAEIALAAFSTYPQISVPAGTATFGRVLVEQSTGYYAPQATSTLGITGSGGTGNVSTSTSETPGYLSYWTSTSATPALLGKVATSSVTISSPLTSSGTAGSVVGGSSWAIGCQTASGAQAGCLSSANWTTFNNKQDALVSGTNIKTINGNTILGSGDMTISGTGGSGGGSWSTTTSSVSGRFINYPNNNTDIVSVGSNSTTSAKFYYDPNIYSLFVNSASSTIAGPLNIVGNFKLPSLTQGFGYIGSGGLFNTLASSSVKLSWFNNDSNFLSSITADSPLTGSGTSASHLSIPQANDSTNGYLASGDWTTFNSKLSAAITGLTQTYGTTQTGATQTFATSSDTNIGLNITNPSANTFTFTPTWIGTLGDSRISSAATWNAKQDALVSGTNIKTINGSSVLGSGDLTVGGSPAGSNGQLQYNASSAFGGVSTTSVSCSGSTSCTSFTAIGSSPITISSTDSTASSSLLGDANTFTGVNKFTNTSSDFSGTWKNHTDTYFQQALVSGTNIKTINGSSVLGSGDLTISGSGSGTWATTTSTVAGELVNYPNNNTDVVSIGSNSTTTAKFYFDPNTGEQVINGGSASSTLSIGSSGHPGCTESRDTGDGAWSHSWFLNGIMYVDTGQCP